jgi:imidazole glycerol phosphate synthase subunit HisF
MHQKEENMTITRMVAQRAKTIFIHLGVGGGRILMDN